MWMNPSLHRAGVGIHGASGPRLRSTWCVSQMGSAGVSAPSSLGLVGAARFRKSCRILKETTTSASCSRWGITLMKKPSLLDFLKATMLEERERRVKTPPVWGDSFLRVIVHLLWVILEVLRLSQFIVLCSSILSCQDQFPGGDNYLKNKTNIFMRKNKLIDQQSIFFF